MAAIPRMQIDHGYAWVVLGSCFLMRGLVEGFWSSIGILLLQLQTNFDVSGSRTAMLGSCIMMLIFSFSPIASALAHRYSNRVVIIGAGITTFSSLFAITLVTNFWHMSILFPIIGIGMGLAYQPSCAAFICYFDKRYALANGINSVSTSIGFIVFPVLMETLIANFGWRGALQIISALMANICICGFIMRPSRYEMRQNKHSNNHDADKTDPDKLKCDEIAFEGKLESKMCNCDLLKDIVKDFDISLFKRVQFLFQGVLSGILYCGFYGYYVYLYPYLVSVGISQMNSSFLMSAVGICHLIARALSLPLGHLVDKKLIKASTLSGVAFMICGIVIIVLPFVKEFIFLMGLVCVFGASAGIGGAFIMVVVTFSAGCKEKASGATSWLLLFCGVGNLLGIYGCGYLYDVSNSYQLSLALCGIFVLCLGANILADPLQGRLQNKLDKRKREQSVKDENNTYEDNLRGKGPFIITNYGFV